MNKQEFEKLTNSSVSNENYAIIEKVYTWHPSIPEVNGKEVIAQLYSLGGIEVMKDMLPKAEKYCDSYALDQIVTQIRSNVNKIGWLSFQLDKISEMKSFLNEFKEKTDKIVSDFNKQCEAKKETT